MEKEQDPMLAAFMEGMELSNETDNENNNEQEKTAGELEQETAEQERLAEEEKNKAEQEEENQETSKEETEKQEKSEVKDEAKKEETKEEQKAEPVDNSEWLKEFEAVLLKKNEYKSLTADQKALAYLKEQHPSLDEDDLLFKAASEFGIGAEKLDDEDLALLSEAEKRELKAQEIKRKELLHTADSFFKSQSEAIELPKIPNPIEADEDYKSYKEFVAQQKEQEKQMKAEEEKIINDIDTTSIKIEKIEIEPKITLDDREFTFKSEFKLDENKRKELAQYAKEYTPTQAEVTQFKSENGTFNMEGYLSHLATIKFQKQIINAAVKEGISQAREEFVEQDLKNSTLRNNQTMQQSNREVDPEVAAMRA